MGGNVAAPVSFSKLQSLLGHAPGPVDMAFLGDSRTAAGNFGNPERLSSNGPQFWTEFLTRGRVRCPLAYNFGIAGQTSGQILNRVQDAISCPAPIVHVCAGVNDATGDPTLANNLAMIKALTAAGKLVIVTPELPRTFGFSAQRLAQQVSVRDGLMALRIKGVYVVDPWPDLVDYTTLTGDPVSGMYWDAQTHPGNLGAFYWGKAIAAVLNQIMPEPYVLPATNGGLYDATYNPYGVLNANPFNFGTGGTLNGGPTGSVPNSVTLTRTGTDIAVASTASVSSNGKLWHQIAISGTPATNTQRATGSQSVPLANISVGDVIEGVCEVEVDAGVVGVHGPSLELNPTGGATTLVSGNYDTWARGVGYAPNVFHTGVIRTPRLIVQSGLTALNFQLIARAEQSQACAMTFRVRAMGVRKLL